MIYSVFQERPGLSYLLLGLIFVIGVAEAVLAGIGAFPDKYDWILGILLFRTVATWPIAAALAGVMAPMSKRTMKYAYGVLLVFFIVSIAAMIAYPALYQSYGTELAWLSAFGLPMGLIIWAWMILVGFIGSLAPRYISAKAYIPLVICPLITGIGVTGLLLMTRPWMPLPDESVGYPLLGLYGLAVSLLFRVFLSRLKWTRRHRSGLLLIPAVALTLALTILTLWGVGWMSDVRTSVLFGGVIFAPFGVVTLRALRSEQGREQQLRDLMIAVVALGIAMASYWVVAIVAFTVAVVLMGSSPFGVMFLLPVLAGIVLFVPVGHLISEMRHPYRNVLVAAIGLGPIVIMTMCDYWFEVLGKTF